MPDESTSHRTTGRRRLDVEQRRDQILRAACRLYASAGYAEVSTGQVAEASGSSQALVFHYFGSKAELYAAVVQHDLAVLRHQQELAEAALASGAPVRDRVRARLEAHLDHVAAHPIGGTPLATGPEPVAAQQVRAEARQAETGWLAEVLGVRGWARHDYALAGWFGFVDQACARWAARGCPDEERPHLVEAALGALQGGLGDWAV